MGDKSILGIDISKATFDVQLIQEEAVKHHVFQNTDEGFVKLHHWLAE